MFILGTRHFSLGVLWRVFGVWYAVGVLVNDTVGLKPRLLSNHTFLRFLQVVRRILISSDTSDGPDRGARLAFLPVPGGEHPEVSQPGGLLSDDPGCRLQGRAPRKPVLRHRRYSLRVQIVVRLFVENLCCATSRKGVALLWFDTAGRPAYVGRFPGVIPVTS